MTARSRIALLAIVATVIGFAAVITVFIRRSPQFLSENSPAFEEVSRAFYHGYAALQVGLLDDAKTQFARATDVVPNEPASWANLGLTELRLGELDPAAQAIDKAAQLAPSNSDIAFLQGQLETGRGRPDEAIARFKRAVDLNPTGLRMRYALAQEIESAGGQNADAQAQELLDQLVRLSPDNVAAVLERARIAAKRSDGRVLQESVASLERRVDAWPAVVVDQYRALQRAAAANDFSEAARAVAVFRNVLLRVPSFREDLLAIRTPAELIAEPFDRFLRLPVSTSKPSPADLNLTFTPETIAGAGPSSTVLSFSSNGTDRPAIFSADAREVRRLTSPAVALSVAGGGSGSAPAASALLPIDWSREFRQDLVFAGASGVRLFLQNSDGTFRDATADAGGTSEAVAADSFGAWTADLEMDGDLDVIVGVNDGPPVALRNNGDGTWRRQQPFSGVARLRAFAWGDLDRDGDPDAALLDAQGALHLFENRQGGQFDAMGGPADVGRVVALALGDVNGDGVTDLILLDDKGTVRRASYEGEKWVVETLTDWAGNWNGAAPGTYRLLVEDLDNNGSPDLVASGAGRSQIWLSDAGHFSALPATPSADIFSVVDLNDDGQLDLVGLSNGQPAQWLGRGTKGYHWQVIRPRAQENAGDQRINSFGIGGEIEIRSGLLTEKQLITGNTVHFGLGTRNGVDVTRIVWPNGVVQADFERGANLAVVADQRLKGSCPWVFADDGHGMKFVTDFLWRSPLGLRINAQDTAGVAQTADWVKIRGDQLAARNGSYDVRITAELWETHFIDQVTLMAVDHRADLDVFVDERFAKQPPAQVVHQVTKPRAVTSARDDAGRDVTEIVARQDGRYLATFSRAGYQGIATDHYVEVELDRESPVEGRSWLVANGWVYPTDSSINLAIGQGGHIEPHGISVEAEDAHGHWIVVAPDLGFPAGKNKTVLIDLGLVARAGIAHARRLRLRTNLEIYWDWLAVADDRSDTPMQTVRIEPRRADLRYRGFSKTDFSRREVPELPRYGEIANTSARWRDLVGYYTRFGDVGELVQAVDDRYVIMNAGDELLLSFSALPAPREGWIRDFVLIGDGWEKDGDFNTTFSKTVLPLPSHDRPDYGASAAPHDLESDPIYKRHSADWQAYHTRFVTPSPFLEGLH
jgi:tetratricopeptide (TPR) repeat protein